MIITVTGPKTSVRLVVHEDCALSRLQYKKLVNCVNPYSDNYEVTGINRYLWARILFFTNVEFFGENWAIAMHKKRCDNWTQVLQNG